eukprot:TRINITY_DN22146_c0_g1_i1.p1 TRINITY_DN22146_c0_g1~~TRINITY_DN22146_c0_g1_i1.p1  ORF type:complete len:339 (+),score=97.94 TRINITY_DN22146_c0_g1_i1:82-1098(+)
MRVIAKNEQAFLEGGIRANVRVDGRAGLEMRPFEVEAGVLEASSGSALCRLGGTEVMVAINAEIGETSEQNPGRGRMHVAVTSAPAVAGMLDTALHEQSRAGRAYNGVLALEIGRVFGAESREPHRGVTEIDPDAEMADSEAAEPPADAGAAASGGIDYTQLAITEDRCWVLHMDVIVLAHDGNVLGAATIAARAALLTATLPKVEVVEGVEGDEAIKVSNLASEAEPIPGLAESVPITVTVAKVAGCLITDPLRSEETCAQTSVSVGITPGREIACMHTNARTGTGDPKRYGLHPADLPVLLRHAELLAQRIFQSIDGQLKEGEEDVGGMDEDAPAH